jgi:hypothetical protein
MAEATEATTAAEHVHKWQPNGLVRQNAVLHSPVSRLDDTLYTKVYSTMVCECGKARNVHVANENQRRRGASR